MVSSVASFSVHFRWEVLWSIGHAPHIYSRVLSPDPVSHVITVEYCPLCSSRPSCQHNVCGLQEIEVCSQVLHHCLEYILAMEIISTSSIIWCPGTCPGVTAAVVDLDMPVVMEGVMYLPTELLHLLVSLCSTQVSVGTPLVTGLYRVTCPPSLQTDQYLTMTGPWLVVIVSLGTIITHSCRVGAG